MKTINPDKIIEFLDHTCDTATWHQVWAWINECSENEAEYHKIQKIWALRNAHRHSKQSEIEASLRKFHQQTAQRKELRRINRIAYIASSVAAALAIALLTIGLLNYSNNQAWQTITADNGNGVLKFTLDDGTRVFLKSGSELSYRASFSTHKRNVKLSGEAFFEVKSDPVHPFTVETNGLNIKVLGTSFNVRTGNSVETVLEKGLVALETTGGKRLVNLKPGQRAVVDAHTEEVTELDDVVTGKYTAWHFNHIVYDNITLPEIISMIEDRHGVSVVYDSSDFDNTAYRLIVNNDESLEQMLQILNLILPIDYTINGERIIIKRVKTLPISNQKIEP